MLHALHTLHALQASRVSEKMNGRYFAQNKIIVSYIEEPAYDKKMKLR